jgi:hypothetical protein
MENIEKPLKTIKRRGRPKKEKEEVKKPIVKKKEKPLKLYYGLLPVPKGYKLASMKEAVDAKKVYYWGVAKVDTKVLGTDNKESKLQIISKMSSLRGRLDRIKKDIGISKNAEDAKKLIEEYNEKRKEILLLNEQLQKIEKLNNK